MRHETNDRREEGEEEEEHLSFNGYPILSAQRADCLALDAVLVKDMAARSEL